MTSKTHIAFGITASLIVLHFTKDMNLLEYIPGIILGSAAPDIDTQKSWAAQSLPLVDDVLRDFGFLKHRGVTHGLTGIAIMIFLLYLIKNDFMFGFGIGYISHCLLDIVSKKIGIICKKEKILYNLFWIVNTGIIINNVIGLENIYEFIIKLWRN